MWKIVLVRAAVAGSLLIGAVGLISSEGMAWAAEIRLPVQQLGQVAAPVLNEISGLAASRRKPGILWLHNDGAQQHVFAVATTGRLVARLRIPVAVVDVEDIAIGAGPDGADYIYLGDIGDNDEDRREVQVVRIAEPDLSEGIGGAEILTEGVTLQRLKYPDGPHNAEALMVDPRTGDLYIATKDDEQTRLYGADAGQLWGHGEPVVLELAATLRVDEVSAGDISPDGSLVILRRENRGWLWKREPDEELAAALSASPRRVLVRSRAQANNGEAVAFSLTGESYYTVSEGRHQVISEFPLPRPASAARP